jgi:hypothetical protein
MMLLKASNEIFSPSSLIPPSFTLKNLFATSKQHQVSKSQQYKHIFVVFPEGEALTESSGEKSRKHETRKRALSSINRVGTSG